MSSKCILDYRFQNGLVQNPDGSQKASLNNCSHQKVDATVTGWGKITDAIEFKSARSYILAPVPTDLRDVESFTIELALKPNATSLTSMRLVESQLLPAAFSLQKKSDGFAPEGSVNLLSGWKAIESQTDRIPTAAWSSITMCYTGDDLVLFINNKVVARRVFSKPDLIPNGNKELFFGTWVDGVRDQFSGLIGGIRVHEGIPAAYLSPIEVAENKGYGEIESKYQDLNGPRGFLGQPTASEQKKGKGLFRTFQGGHIYWSVDTGAHEVHGDILKQYLVKSGATGILGFPRSDEENGKRNGSKVNQFESGAIYWSSATGAKEVHGMIFARYLDIGAEGSFLGLPKTDELTVAGGKKSSFEGGNIYWSGGSGAFEVHGIILDKYISLKETGGILGFPLSDEIVILSGLNKPTTGRLSKFQYGTIYWSPSSGAYEVHGEIGRLYNELGGPKGTMGFPVTNETAHGSSGICYNDFQKGIIIWKSGIGAKAINDLRLYLGMVRCGSMDDGIGFFKKDTTAELVTYSTVKVNNTIVRNNVRSPGGHAGSSHEIKYTTTIANINHATKIYFKTKVDDWDEASSNDYLGTIEKTFDITNLFGLTGGDPEGAYFQQPCTQKGGDISSLNTLQFDYSIQKTAKLDPNLNFREQCWWSFDNFSTKTLSRKMYADTFRDVEIAESTWDKLMSPFDSIYYGAAYSGCASKGNCFGMSLEALSTYHNQSIFAEPLYQYKAAGGKYDVEEADLSKTIRETINMKHGYQLGASAIRWVIGKLGNLDAVRPLNVYNNVEYYVRNRQFPIISMMNLDGFSGHAVLAYKVQRGTGSAPHRIYVADPNVPWGSKTGDPSYIEVYQNNTFKFFGSSLSYQSSTIVNGLLPGTLMFEIPFHVVSTIPRTPFWEILSALAFLIGGILILFGDAETDQLTSDGLNYYKKTGAKRYPVPNGIPGASRIPLLDFTGQLPELYAFNGKLGKNITLQLNGKKNGSFKQMLRSLSNAISVESPIALNAVDTIRVADAHTPKPVLSLTSSQQSKTSKISYGVTLDPKGRDYRRFDIDLQVSKGVTSRLTASPRGGSIEIESGGSVKPVKVAVEMVVNNQLKKVSFTHTPSSSNEVIRIRPKDLTSSLNKLVIERLSSLGGTVVNRIIKDIQ